MIVDFFVWGINIRVAPYDNANPNVKGYCRLNNDEGSRGPADDRSKRFKAVLCMSGDDLSLRFHTDTAT